jgi:sec-independent protein translocase protein TatA
MGNIGISELLVLFFIILLFFGAKRIPEVAKALGKASREYNKARDGVIDELEQSGDTVTDRPPQEKNKSGKENNAE